MPAVFGAARKIHGKHKFVVEFDSGIVSAAFAKCSELKVDIAEITYHEGGNLIPIKDAGLMTFADVTLDRGASDDFDFYSWVKQVADAAVGPGGAGAVFTDYKRGLDIVQRDRDNETLRRWSLYGSWPKSYTAGAWDNSANEVVMEQLVLAYDYFESAAT